MYRYFLYTTIDDNMQSSITGWCPFSGTTICKVDLKFASKLSLWWPMRYSSASLLIPGKFQGRYYIMESENDSYYMHQLHSIRPQMYSISDVKEAEKGKPYCHVHHCRFLHLLRMMMSQQQWHHKTHPALLYPHIHHGAQKHQKFLNGQLWWQIPNWELDLLQYILLDLTIH